MSVKKFIKNKENQKKGIVMSAKDKYRRRDHLMGGFINKGFLLMLLAFVFLAGCVCDPGDKMSSISATNIQLSDTNAFLYISNDVQSNLMAVILPENHTDTLEWSSSLPNIVRIDSNADNTVWFTSTNFGTSRLSALAGSERTFIDVVVTNFHTPATNIRLTDSNRTIIISNNMQSNLTAIVLPANHTDSLEWTTSDSSVVRIDSTNNNTMQFTTVSDGTATLTVTAGSVSTNIEVLVTNFVSATNITISILQGTNTNNRGDTVVLLANVLPSDYTPQTITWSVSNESILSSASSGSGNALSYTIIGSGDQSGVVTVRASLSGVSDEIPISFIIKPTGIQVRQKGGFFGNTFTFNNQTTGIFEAVVTPTNHEAGEVAWTSSQIMYYPLPALLMMRQTMVLIPPVNQL